jgi:hypothetical protein
MATRVILEAGRANREYFRDLWRYREYFRDLWRYRELFLVLAWRDVSVRYKQTVVGIDWAVLRPALTTIVFTVIFGKLRKFPSGRGALSDAGAYRHASLAPLQRWPEREREQSDCQLEPDHQGLPSKTDQPRQFSHHHPHRLPHLCRDAGGGHGSLQRDARLAGDPT